MSTYKTSEFAKKIGVCERTLRRWDENGVLPAYKTPTNRRFYTEEQLQTYLKQSKRDRYILELCGKCGKGYTLKTIDWERCIYKDFGNGYDIEISLVSKRHTSASVYVWHKNTSGGYEMVESNHDISHNKLPELLRIIEGRYAHE